MIFTVFILYGTTLPFDFTSGLAGARYKLEHLPLNPLISPDTGRRDSILDVVQNVLLFVPFGILGIASGRGDRKLVRLAAVTALGAGLSVCVEGLQLFSPVRVTSVGDVTADTLGTLAGGVAALVGQAGSRRALRSVRQAGVTDVEEFYPLMVFALLLCVAAWEPFDVTLDVGTAISRIRSLHHDPWQYGGVLTDEGVELLRYVLFGGLLASWLAALRRDHPRRQAAVLGGLVAFVLEGGQFFISSRMPGLEDAVVHATGATIGAALALAPARFPRPTAWLACLVVATGIGSGLQSLSPFEIAATPRFRQWIPFMNHYSHTTFDGLSHVIEMALIYFPLGFCLPRLPPAAKHPTIWAVGLTILLAVPIEWMQGWIVGRYPDVTDIAIGACGAWFGVWVATVGRSAFQEAREEVSGSVTKVGRM